MDSCGLTFTSSELWTQQNHFWGKDCKLFGNFFLESVTSIKNKDCGEISAQTHILTFVCTALVHTCSLCGVCFCSVTVWRGALRPTTLRKCRYRQHKNTTKEEEVRSLSTVLVNIWWYTRFPRKANWIQADKVMYSPILCFTVSKCLNLAYHWSEKYLLISHLYFTVAI